MARRKYKLPPVVGADIEAEFLPTEVFSLEAPVEPAWWSDFHRPAAYADRPVTMPLDQFAVDRTPGEAPEGGFRRLAAEQVWFDDASFRFLKLSRDGFATGHHRGPNGRERAWTSGEAVRRSFVEAWGCLPPDAFPGRQAVLRLRYTNRFDLGDFELGSYLRTLPDLSADLPGSLSAYLMHLELPQADGFHATFVQRSVDPVGGSRVSIASEVTVASPPCSLESFREEATLSRVLLSLHEIENRIFESTLTDRLRREVLEELTTGAAESRSRLADDAAAVDLSANLKP